ncbi:uncharacterized protein LOC129593594 [Paramacrobiotus metropolitanus]|uniref:uncharacterized protein LOC129593594 n=1 Tax=Paramacrobiotus metropolitanus TaxID=2943436 RepID=UPI002445CECF|nr:uncharacterized protein LOC129593594 [Paramacrobiotus metropolitanus]
MLKLNLWVSVGLVNGATGTVDKVVYELDSRPPALPIAIFVRFDKYHGPGFPGLENCVPIKPVTKSWSNVDCPEFKSNKQHCCSRTAIPLVQADAVTIHSSQGRTMEKTVVDLGKKEFAPSLGFTGSLRTRRLSDLAYGKTFDFKRIQFSGSRVIADRLKEEARLESLAKSTFCNGETAYNTEQAEMERSNPQEGSDRQEEKNERRLAIWSAFLNKTLADRRLTLVNVAGDSNCFYRALSFALYGTEDRHLGVRTSILEFHVTY